MEQRLVADLVCEVADWEGPLDLPDLEIECPTCNAFHPGSEWKAYEVPCGCCGGHNILMCAVDPLHTFDPWGAERGLKLNVRPTPNQP